LFHYSTDIKPKQTLPVTAGMVILKLAFLFNIEAYWPEFTNYPLVDVEKSIVFDHVLPSKSAGLLKCLSHSKTLGLNCVHPVMGASTAYIPSISIQGT